MTQCIVSQNHLLVSNCPTCQIASGPGGLKVKATGDKFILVDALSLNLKTPPV